MPDLPQPLTDVCDTFLEHAPAGLVDAAPGGPRRPTWPPSEGGPGEYAGDLDARGRDPADLTAYVVAQGTVLAG